MKLLGGLLMGAGILIAGASGLCSLVLIVVSLSDAPNPAELLVQGLAVVLLVGGIPFAIGLGMFFGGRAIIRQADNEAGR